MLLGERFGIYAFLKNYSAKCLGTGASVYFHLGVSATNIYFKHMPRHHTMFKFFERLLV